MILIKIDGKPVWIISLIIGFFFYSCSPIKNKVSQRNFFNKDYFYNDSLKVAIDFEEDLEFSDVSFAKTNEYVDFLKEHTTLSSKDFFLHVQSVKRELEMSFFFKNSSVNNENNAVSTKMLFKDTISNCVVFEKQKGAKRVVVFVKSHLKEDCTIMASQLMSRISIDSVIKWQLSPRSLLQNYFYHPHPNDLLAREKIDKLPFKNDTAGKEWRFGVLATINSFIANNKRYDTIKERYEKSIKEQYNPMLFDLLRETTIKKNSSSDSYNKDVGKDGSGMEAALSEEKAVYKNEQVFDKIGEIAKSNRVIMLNENHFYPNHRLFAMQLLTTLKQNGYTHLSLEAFYPSEDNKNPYFPKREDGYYLNEPYFAHFVRKAKELGFVIQGHESDNGCIGREMGQAKNILRILEDNPKAKVFVYVGLSHLEKENLKDDKRWMASIFKELSGITPVTINQSEIYADNSQDLLLLPRHCLTENGRKQSSADYFLVNNLIQNLNLIYPDVPFKKVKIKDRKIRNYRKNEVLVEVVDFKEFELLDKSAIPISSFLVIPKNKKICFELPVGKYHVYVKTVDNKTIYDDDIIVQ